MLAERRTADWAITGNPDICDSTLLRVRAYSALTIRGGASHSVGVSSCARDARYNGGGGGQASFSSTPEECSVSAAKIAWESYGGIASRIKFWASVIRFY